MRKQQGAAEIPISEAEEESVVIIVLVGWTLLRRVTGRSVLIKLLLFNKRGKFDKLRCTKATRTESVFNQTSNDALFPVFFDYRY